MHTSSGNMSVITDLEPLFDDVTNPSEGLVIVGPCSAESAAQVDRIARQLSEEGIRYFRAGAWKPRTKPGSFEGYGAEALAWISRAGQRHGMKSITEVATPAHLAAAIAAGIDGIWIGARTVVNPFAVQAIADALSRYPADVRRRLTVLVKNPVNPDIELWIGALERIWLSGIRRLGAVHRGFGAYGETRYRNAPMWRIPIELHRRIPALPLICDPSHIGGNRDLILPLSREAFEIGFDGLMIEVHDEPDRALSDAAQQITPSMLSQIMASLCRKAGKTDAGAELADLRTQIDAADRELIETLSRRLRLCDKIGEIKRNNGISVVQPRRYRELMDRIADEGKALGLDPSFIRNIFSIIHEESVRRQL